MAEIMNNENNDTFFLFKIVIIGSTNILIYIYLRSYMNINVATRIPANIIMIELFIYI